MNGFKISSLLTKKMCSVSSNARRYPNKKQDMAFVHFNITAGTVGTRFLQGP